MNRQTILVFWAPICLQVSCAQIPRHPSQEQLRFSAEDESVRRPVVVPEGALAIVKKDPYVIEFLDGRDTSAAEPREPWLVASEVHLAGPDERDIVVVATGRLRGANVTTFWVLRPTGHGFELLLTAPAHDLIVRNSRSQGYRDIQILATPGIRVSAVSFRFDGNQYKVYGRSSENIR
jgi:hypothetical protein